MKLGVPTLLGDESLDQLLESAVRGAVTPTGYVIIDNGGFYTRSRAEAIIGRTPGATLQFVTPSTNLGVAASWNLILDLAGAEPIVIANDDVVLGQNTFAEMSGALERTLFVSGDGWALFGQRPDCTRLVGPYDENIWPAYYEDVDYDIRLRRAGVTPTRPLSAPVRHADGSTARGLGESGWLSQAGECNRRYVIAKWGADCADAATYQEPFNGHPPPGWSERKGPRSMLPHDSSPAGPTIGLCMIVRDEAAVIGRCIESARPLIDCWQICDTGSGDGTPNLVGQLLADVPGRLHQRPWRDFGWNRTELMALAAGSADYLLLLDADMTLRWEGALPPLSADAYLLRHAGDLSYAVPRLVRGDRKWWFEGSTHEYLATDGPYTQEVLDALVVEHHGDGGSRAEKFERDAALLERDLVRQPDNARTTFYLAQTHRDLGNDQRAIELYEHRAALGGWDEEVFYSTYQAGVLLARRDDDAALGTLLDAWQRRPQRAEPLYELVRLLRYRRLYQAAYGFARHAVELARPVDLLFVHEWIYEWGLRFELAVVAYWVGDVDRARQLNEALLADARLPPDIEAAVRENLAYCIAEGSTEPTTERDTGPAHRECRSLKDLCPSFDFRPLELEVTSAWPRFNPTIAADDEGFRLIVRTANYRIVDGRYRFLTDDDVIRTVNYSVRLNDELKVVAAAPLLDSSRGPELYPTRVRGYEDCRLLRVGEAWVATATVRDRNPVERCEMALLLLEDDEVTAVTILKSPWPGRHEKNWMPFSVDGGLYALYSCDPTVVLQVDPSTGAPQRVIDTPGPKGADSLRGGSQGVHIRDGLLFVVHEAIDHSMRRAYSHRFVLMDRDYRIAGLSPPFRLAGEEIEFCAGIAQRGGEFVLTFGIGDHSAALGVVEADQVMAMLEQCEPAPIPRRKGVG